MAGIDAIDRCTSWPDGWPSWLGGTGDEWRHCCKLHDDFYDVKRPFLEFVNGHYELAKCVWDISPWMAVVMFIGLMTIGGLHLIWIKNKRSKRNVQNQ